MQGGGHHEAEASRTGQHGPSFLHPGGSLLAKVVQLLRSPRLLPNEQLQEHSTVSFFSILVVVLEFLLTKVLGRANKASSQTVGITGTVSALRLLLDDHELDPKEKLLNAERILASARHAKT